MDTGPNLLIISFFLYQLFVHNTALPASVWGLQIPDKAPIVCAHTHTGTHTQTHSIRLVYRQFVITDSHLFFHIDRQHLLTLCALTFTRYSSYTPMYAMAHSEPHMHTLALMQVHIHTHSSPAELHSKPQRH